MCNSDMEFRYRIETHLHTKEGSLCGGATGEEHAIARKQEGYDTIIVTDHFYRGNTAPSRDLPWEDYIEEFCKGYENAKKKGDEIGLTVLFGIEDNYHGAEFLIYGLDKRWLLKHPEMKHWSPREEYEAVHAAGALMIQAHPFRERGYLEGISLYPKYIDGVEAINSSQPKYMNDHARWFAEEYHFPMTAGSDIHHKNSVMGGMLTTKKIETIQQYIDLVRSREPYRLLEVHSPS